MNILVPVSLYKLLGGGVLAGKPRTALIKGWSLHLTSCFLPGPMTSLAHRMRPRECETLGAQLSRGRGAPVGPVGSSQPASEKSYVHVCKLPAWPPVTTSSWSCPFLGSVSASLQVQVVLGRTTVRLGDLSLDQASSRKEERDQGRAWFEEAFMTPGFTPRPLRRGSCGEGAGLISSDFPFLGQGESLAFSTNESMRPGMLPEELGREGQQ